jgi:hypothetical protein
MMASGSENLAPEDTTSPPATTVNAWIANFGDWRHFPEGLAAEASFTVPVLEEDSFLPTFTLLPSKGVGRPDWHTTGERERGQLNMAQLHEVDQAWEVLETLDPAQAKPHSWWLCMS